jgi:hypothetical protein|tara:strand:+ start:2015 stop:2158 length:144 start_codon:yes stop_codon:yes gene_type:complete
MALAFESTANVAEGAIAARRADVRVMERFTISDPTASNDGGPAGMGH